MSILLCKIIRKMLKHITVLLYIMKYLTAILQKLFRKEQPKPVGRWNIEYCHTKMNNKIDLSNEDHCGPCGQYALTKVNLSKTHIDSNSIEKTS